MEEEIIITETAEAAEPSSQNEDLVEEQSKDELEALRTEVAALKAELEEKAAMAEVLSNQLGEFGEIFPDADIKSLPDEVWAGVKKGNSIAAAYALYQKKQEAIEARVNDTNKKNARLSSGKLSGGSSNEFFTPAEVKAMSAREVKANYSKIIESMKRWN